MGPKVPIPMFASGVITDKGSEKPVSGAVVQVLNKDGKAIENPATGKPLESTTDATGKYNIIFGFNGVTAGETLSITSDGKTTKVAIDKPNATSQTIQIGEEQSWLKKHMIPVIVSSVTLVGLVIAVVIIKKRRANK